MEPITKEFIEENFPEIAEEFRKEGMESASEEAQAVDEVVEIADMDDEEEKAIISQARSGDITPGQASQKILQVRSKKKKETDKPENKKDNMLQLLQSRGEDQPGVPNSGDTAQSNSIGQKTAQKIAERRGR